MRSRSPRDCASRESARQALDEVSPRYQATPAQTALAWLLARPSVTAPIASATSLDQLAALIKATEITLDREAIDALDKASGS